MVRVLETTRYVYEYTVVYTTYRYILLCHMKPVIPNR